jgi:hypothetical protein
METLRNYLLEGCICISINTKRNEGNKLSWLIFIIYYLYFLRNKYLINKYFLFRFMYLFYNLFISLYEKKIILISDLFYYYIYIYSHKPL